MNNEEYFAKIQEEVNNLYGIARDARAKGYDPAREVEIKLATTLAAKAVGLISTIYPQMDGQDIVNRIIELEKEYGQLAPEISFKIAEEVAKQKFCSFKSQIEAIDAGIRIGFAYSTLGVVSSPIEGYTMLKTNKNEDGGEYFVPYFSGPIRSAGTTASCVVLILIDYLREVFGYSKYKPTEREVKRTITELYDYHERITNLQYLPTEEEAEFLARNLPIQVSGEPTEDREVSNYKDLLRIETNFIRGGFCLILGEGLAQKAQKGLRILRKLQKSGFKISGWEFLEEYAALHKKRDEGKKSDASPTYIKDLVAGRPIFGHPSASGSFRFRYGRSRFGGFSATSVHPATMAITSGFISVGTQLKVEKPIKGCAVTVCDSIEGPIVKMHNGSVKKVNSVDEAKNLYKDVEEIIYLGDILFSFGDVLNRNHALLKQGYCEEWWALEAKKAAPFLNMNPRKISFDEAVKLSEEYDIPLHPKYIYYWTQIDYNLLCSLLYWLENSYIEKKLILPYSLLQRRQFSEGKRALELIGVPHEVVTENVVLKEEESRSLLYNLGILPDIFENSQYSLKEDITQLKLKVNPSMLVLEIINKLAFVPIKDKAGTFIGARMGRPEKAKLRKLVGSPSVLFPVGEEGGRFRSMNEASEKGTIKGDFPIYYCTNCKRDTIYARCESCDKETEQRHYCHDCKAIVYSEKCEKEGHSNTASYLNRRIDSAHYLASAANKLGISRDGIPPLIKGVRGTSNKNHALENVAKGVLRAKYNLSVNKDGTVRYDATELPVTHFKPKEIGVSSEKLKEIGYERDIYGMELTNDEQVLEIKPHDIILPSCPESKDEKSEDVFLNVAKFIDELLARFYGEKPFYNIERKDQLIGQLVVCMSPHNCAGVVGRIIGFSKTQGLLASPFIHAAMRRDCLGYNNYVGVQENGVWKVEKIGEFVERNKPENKVDIYGTLGKKMQGINTWSNPGRGEIIELTKHQPTDMVRIHLEDGRKIEATSNHQLFLKGKIMKRAGDILAGDKLIVSYKRNIEEVDIEELFLPEIFQDRDDVMLKNLNNYLIQLEKINKHSNFYQRDSYPIMFVKSFLKKHGKLLKDLPASVRISIKRDNVELPIRIPVDREFMEVVGLYISEGHIRKNDSKKGFYQLSIAGNEKVKEFVKKIFDSHFGLNASYENKDSVTFSSRILYELFKDYLSAGHNARTKRIPSMFLNLKKEKIAALLRGYYEGDGSVSLSDIRVCCDTVSEGLKHDLSFVLSRFGIYTKFYEYEKEPGPVVRGFYIKKNRDIPKFRITKIIILSNFVKKFKEIGFISKRKKEILDDICEQNPYGTKIDFDEQYAYPKVVRIEQMKEDTMYCFNVAPEHNFFANDILVKNCDGDESAVMLLLDVLLNFSREFLPAHRGGTQDAPLVLNSRLRAGEVDEQILDFDVVREYPLQLYELAEKGAHSSEVSIKTIRDVLKKGEDAFSNIGYTHETDDINKGLLNSSYKFLPTMHDKVSKQMELVKKIRAVDESDVARLIIERHFIRDIRGNLRKFSQQTFRCVNCNEIYRRPPLVGRCLKCEGRIIFTVSHGSIVKYLEPAIELATRYDVSPYVRQSLFLAKSYIESIFGKEKHKQVELGKWFLSLPNARDPKTERLKNK